MSEHPVEQEIAWLQVDTIPDAHGSWTVGGPPGVTRIEAYTKSGMYADIPYLRVWKGDECLAEYCQHNIVGIGFKVVAK